MNDSFGMLIVVGIIFLILKLPTWMLYKKAGEHGWACLVPVYNSVVFFRIAVGSGIKMLFLLIPLFGEFYAIYAFWQLGKKFGKSTGFCIGLLLLPEVFYLILAFGKSTYEGMEDEVIEEPKTAKKKKTNKPASTPQDNDNKYLKAKRDIERNLLFIDKEELDDYDLEKYEEFKKRNDKIMAMDIDDLSEEEMKYIRITYKKVREFKKSLEEAVTIELE